MQFKKGYDKSLSRTILDVSGLSVQKSFFCSLFLFQGQIGDPLDLVLVWVDLLQNICKKLNQLGILDSCLLGPELLEQVCCGHWPSLLYLLTASSDIASLP